MRTGRAAGNTGYLHEAVYYASDDDLLAVVVPFVLDGVAAAEPTIVSLGERNTELVRAALPAGAAGKVEYRTLTDMYPRPASAIRSYRKLLAEHTAAGAPQIRIFGELPERAFGATWDWWARYESAVNHAYAEFPLWSMCAYDTRTTPVPVLEDVARTHPSVALPGDGNAPSEGYVEPREFLLANRPPVPDPLQRTTPVLQLVNPVPADARTMLAKLNHSGGHAVLTEPKLADLQIAVTETVTNAMNHGRPPVLLRCWVGADRVVVTVTDRGPGPTDPFAGLQAAAHAPVGGLGMWLTHQLCDHVALHRDDEGFTIRLTSGNPPA